MKQYISNCKFTVVPSIWYENCPFSIIEALTMGKPVIGSNIGGIPELVKNEENGFTYEYSNTIELAKKMKELFTNEELTKKLGENAKINAKKAYAKDTYYDKRIKIYENNINNVLRK